MNQGSENPVEPWWREWPLALAVLTLTLMVLGQGRIAAALGRPAMLIALLVILCGVILAAAVAIVRHADVLAHRLGEPAGTLQLTLITATLTFSLPRTNVLLGCVHLLLFGAYLMLMFDR
jgi:Ca2+/H+ antiporter